MVDMWDQNKGTGPIPFELNTPVQEQERTEVAMLAPMITICYAYSVALQGVNRRHQTAENKRVMNKITQVLLQFATLTKMPFGETWQTLYGMVRKDLHEICSQIIPDWKGGEIDGNAS